MIDPAVVYDDAVLDDPQSIPETGRVISAELEGIEERRFADYFYEDPATAEGFSDPTIENTFTSPVIAPEKRDIERGPVFWSAPAPITPTFKVLQEWEGMVDHVFEDYFTARVVDVTKKNPDEYVEFDIEEVDDDDVRLLESGAIFYWSIGYYTSTFGQRRRSSEIRFRRLPAWSPSDISTAEKKAASLAEHLGLDPETSL